MSMVKKGRVQSKKEAPGPSCVPPKRKLDHRPRVAARPISQRGAVIDVARISPELLARIMIEIGVLPGLEGPCKACKCGTMGPHLRKS
eukprot:613379-Pyramimonas_sp.AAC.1